MKNADNRCMIDILTPINTKPQISRAVGLLADCRIRSGGLLLLDDATLSIPAHRAVLAARCPRMASHFRFTDSVSGATAEGAEDGLPVFAFPSLSPRTLRLLLAYLYTDRLEGCERAVHGGVRVCARMQAVDRCSDQPTPEQQCEQGVAGRQRGRRGRAVDGRIGGFGRNGRRAPPARPAVFVRVGALPATGE